MTTKFDGKTWEVEYVDAEINKTILDEAKQVVYADRAKSYGNPEDNFAAIAAYWSAYIQHNYQIHLQLSASDVALMLMLLKVGRATTGQYKRDTAVDIAGYADCYARINEAGEKL